MPTLITTCTYIRRQCSRLNERSLRNIFRAFGRRVAHNGLERKNPEGHMRVVLRAGYSCNSIAAFCKQPCCGALKLQIAVSLFHPRNAGISMSSTTLGGGRFTVCPMEHSNSLATPAFPRRDSPRPIPFTGSARTNSDGSPILNFGNVCG